MDNQVTQDPYRILARERSHEDARQTVATNRMLVQSLVIINGGAATAVLAYYGAHNASGLGKSAALLTIILYCLGSLLPFSLVSTSGEQLKNGQVSGSLSLTPTWLSRKKSWKDTDCRRSGVSAGRPGCSYLVNSSFSPPVYVWLCPWDSVSLRNRSIWIDSAASGLAVPASHMLSMVLHSANRIKMQSGAKNLEPSAAS